MNARTDFEALSQGAASISGRLCDHPLHAEIVAALSDETSIRSDWAPKAAKLVADMVSRSQATPSHWTVECDIAGAEDLEARVAQMPKAIRTYGDSWPVDYYAGRRDDGKMRRGW